MSETFIIAARLRLKKKSVTAWLRSPWPAADAIDGLDTLFAGGPWAEHAGLTPLAAPARSVRHGLAALADGIAAREQGSLVCAWSGSARAVVVYHVMIGWQPEAVARTAYALAAASAHWTAKKPGRVVLWAETSGRLSPEGRLAVMTIDGDGAAFVSGPWRGNLTDLAPAEALGLEAMALGAVDALHTPHLFQPAIRQVSRSKALKKRARRVPAYETAEDWLAAMAGVRLLDRAETSSDPHHYDRYVRFERDVMPWASQVERFGVATAPALAAYLEGSEFAPGILAFWALNRLSIWTGEPFYYLWALERWRRWRHAGRGTVRGEVTQDDGRGDHDLVLYDTPFRDMSWAAVRDHPGTLLSDRSWLEPVPGLLAEVAPMAVAGDTEALVGHIGSHEEIALEDRSVVIWAWLCVCDALGVEAARALADGIFEAEVQRVGGEAIADAHYAIGHLLTIGAPELPPRPEAGLAFLREARASGLLSLPPDAPAPRPSPHAAAIEAVRAGDGAALSAYLASGADAGATLDALAEAFAWERGQPHVFAASPHAHQAFLAGFDTFGALDEASTDGLILLATGLAMAAAWPPTNPWITPILETLEQRGKLGDATVVWFRAGRASTDHVGQAARLLALACVHPGGVQTQAAKLAAPLFEQLGDATSCVEVVRLAHSRGAEQFGHAGLLNTYFMNCDSPADPDWDRMVVKALARLAHHAWLTTNLVYVAVHHQEIELGRRVIATRLESGPLPDSVYLNAAMLESCPGGEDTEVERYCAAARATGDEARGLLVLGCLRARQGRRQEAIGAVEAAHAAGCDFNAWKTHWLVEALREIPEIAGLLS